MRWGVVAVVVGLVAGGVARAADPPEKVAADQLVRDGQTLGEANQYVEALAKFKEAARLYPRAVDDCNIGAAYAELAQWPQAQLFLDRCRSRASSPAQREFADRRLAETTTALGADAYAPVEVVVEPAGAAVTVSSFAPDESFTPPRVVWLAHGKHQLAIERDGYQSVTVEVEVPADKRVFRKLVAVDKPKVEPARVEVKPAVAVPPARHGSSRHKWGKILIYSGLGVA